MAKSKNEYRDSEGRVLVEVGDELTADVVAALGNAIRVTNEQRERTRLEAKYGQVYDTQEAMEAFEFRSFLAPFAVVTDRETNRKGALTFQHSPRFYFDFQPFA